MVTTETGGSDNGGDLCDDTLEADMKTQLEIDGGSEIGDGTPLDNDLKTKQRKKEEGRRRALEISLAKQKISNDINDDPQAESKRGKRANRMSARHGARNQHRHKHFARWILGRFPHVLEDCIGAKVVDHSSRKADASIQTPTSMHVLDVAGGKGELSARLSLCHSLNVVMVDPRPADVESVYMNSVVTKLPKKWQNSVEDRLQESPTFVQDLLEERFTQLVMPFSAPSQSFSPPPVGVACQYQDGTLDAAVRNASLLIGLHADGATEAIVDAALSYGKPFVVVPCCVFPNLFRERYVCVPIDKDFPEINASNRECNESQHSNETRGKANDTKEKRVPVRTHDQFCKYLLAKDSRFVMEVVPFEGRNIAIWWDGQ